MSLKEGETTVAVCLDEILANYKAEALHTVLYSRISALGSKRPVDLLDDEPGRQRVYGWALGLSEGVMG